MTTRRKHADVKELLQNVAPPKNLGAAEAAAAEMQEAQSAFLSKANFALDDLQTPNPVTSGKPSDFIDDFEKMEYAAAEVTAKINSALSHYKMDETSKALYTLEKDRWDLVTHFARVATNFARDKIPTEEAKSWLTAETKLQDLKTRHAAYSKLDPNRSKLITAGDTIIARPKAKNKSAPTSNTGDLRKKQLELVVLTVEVAKLIAVATQNDLDNYDDAAKNLKSAMVLVDEIGQKAVEKPVKHVKLDTGDDSSATQMLHKKGQFIKYAGVVYKLVK